MSHNQIQKHYMITVYTLRPVTPKRSGQEQKHNLCEVGLLFLEHSQDITGRPPLSTLSPSESVSIVLWSQRLCSRRDKGQECAVKKHDFDRKIGSRYFIKQAIFTWVMPAIFKLYIAYSAMFLSLCCISMPIFPKPCLAFN